MTPFPIPIKSHYLWWGLGWAQLVQISLNGLKWVWEWILIDRIICQMNAVGFHVSFSRVIASIGTEGDCTMWFLLNWCTWRYQHSSIVIYCWPWRRQIHQCNYCLLPVRPLQWDCLFLINCPHPIFLATCYLIIACDNKMGCYMPHVQTSCTALSISSKTFLLAVQCKIMCIFIPLHKYTMVWKDQDTLIKQSKLNNEIVSKSNHPHVPLQSEPIRNK